MGVSELSQINPLAFIDVSRIFYPIHLRISENLRMIISQVHQVLDKPFESFSSFFLSYTISLGLSVYLFNFFLLIFEFIACSYICT